MAELVESQNTEYLKILVVDHHEDFLKSTESMLKQRGLIIFKATNAISALSQFELRLPDFVLLEIDLPIIDGFVVLRKMKSLLKGMNHHTRILMLTERNHVNDVKKALAEGAHDYLVKPISRERLLEKIQKHIIHVETPKTG